MADCIREAEKEATKAMLVLESENSHRQTRMAHRQQQREECAEMELREELTEEQLQQMTEFQSKNQTNRFTPS